MWLWWRKHCSSLSIHLPLWMEKFIATIKWHSVLGAETMEHKDYDLRKPEDEVACRA
jgi:hypothetical protein